MAGDQQNVLFFQIFGEIVNVNRLKTNKKPFEDVSKNSHFKK